MNERPAAQQGLVPAARVIDGEIVTADAYNARVAEWRDSGFSVLTPAVALSSIPRDHKIAVTRVQINPNPAGGEVYTNPLFTKAGEVALSKVGLEKIAQCAGISIDEIERVDSRTVPHVWSYRVYGHWIGFDGARIDRVATKTLDLRDGSADIKGFTANQIEQARRHGEAVCESKAINRLYRQYGLKQKYPQAELAERPFIVLKLQWDPDMSNPIVAALLTQMRAGATRLMFPQGLPGAIDPAGLPAHQVPPEMRPASTPRDVDEDDEPLAKNGDEPFTPASVAPTREETRDPLYHVAQVMRRKSGGFYLLLTEAGDKQFLTNDERVATAAHGAKEKNQLVSLDLEGRGTETWIVQMSVVKSDAGY
jgi:hypothetical protein